MRFQCQHCNHWNEVSITLNPRQLAVLKAVRITQQRDGRGVASSTAIAVEAAYSERWTKITLHELEQTGHIFRPNGPKSGWHTLDTAPIYYFQARLETAA